MFHGKISKDTAKGLKELRKRIDKAKIPSSKLDESLNLATWNIRNFGKKRSIPASSHFIAEILGQFDLIAVTEVKDNLAGMARVMEILGPYWRVVFSDYISDHGGNRERIAYVYDKRMVTFTGLASEPNAPRAKTEKGEWVPEFSWWRSPYMASFSAGNFDFMLIAAHIRWGSGKKARIKPLKLLAEWIDKRRREKHVVDKDIILLGDFNIPKVDDALFKAITSKGLKMPKAIRGIKHGSNLAKNKRYDQILHNPNYSKCFTNNAGVIDFYTGGIDKLYPGRKLSKKAFTFQMSDHLPLWIQIDTDTDTEQLDQILKPGRKKK